MSIPVIDVAQMRAWEQATWESGQTESAVIQQAGRAVGVKAAQMTHPGDAILILAGKGHNGDDACQAVPELPERSVRVLRIIQPENEIALVQQHLEPEPALIIDGLFGIGLNRPLSGAWNDLIRLVNQCHVPILAVDVPSGLNADTGEPFGETIRASVTVCLGSPKTGLVKSKATIYVGRLEVAGDIGLIACPHRGDLHWTEGWDFKNYPPPRTVSGHKGTHGHVLLMAGSKGYHGAAVLASRAALCARPGLVSLWTPQDVYLPIASQLQAVMVHPWHAGLRTRESVSSVVIGPGLADASLSRQWQVQVEQIWQTWDLPVVVDASALDWLPPGPISSSALRLITPHPGEAARILKISTGAVQEDRPGTLRELSWRWGNCWVVLKGHQSLVGRAESTLYLNPTGNPYLAQGGSGDVLAGLLGGLLAQPMLQAHPELVIRYAVWLHGLAADYLQAHRINWTIDSLVNLLEQGFARPQ